MADHDAAPDVAPTAGARRLSAGGDWLPEHVERALADAGHAYPTSVSYIRAHFHVVQHERDAALRQAAEQAARVTALEGLLRYCRVLASHEVEANKHRQQVCDWTDCLGEVEAALAAAAAQDEPEARG